MKKVAIIILSTFFTFLFVVLPFLYVYGTQDILNCTLESKERIVDDDKSRYLIFCEDEVLENTDSLLYLKFNSSDLYKDMKEGNEYSVKVYGWRIPFLSTYRNIVDFE